MVKVQILESELFLSFADTSKEVYLLSRLTDKELPAYVNNIPEVTESFHPLVDKLPQLLSQLSYLYSEYDYVLVTDDKNKYSVQKFIVPSSKFKLVSIQEVSE